eukprot:9918907-Lingulodinium_polyedra.AAC.1
MPAWHAPRRAANAPCAAVRVAGAGETAGVPPAPASPRAEPVDRRRGGRQATRPSVQRWQGVTGAAAPTRRRRACHARSAGG